ncbi:MAG: ComF family protein [Chloroflexi bacterium]|nr:ComF family protein [Chloroflexota bacterium]
MNLKYQRQYGLGDVLISPVTKLIEDIAWHIDILIPVPLGKKRLKERGYNQAGALARPLAWFLGLPYRPNALRRTRETVSQVGLSKIEREKNVLGAFQARSDLVTEKNVLLVDDVWTTGATINACAQALKKGNANKVFAVTLSRVADTRLY